MQRPARRACGRTGGVRHDQRAPPRRRAPRARGHRRPSHDATEVTVGIDIGTSSVKAIAADGDGNVVRSARVPHEVGVPSPMRFEHDADAAWRRGPRAALAAVAEDVDVRAVSVAAMVPSLTAVDADGDPARARAALRRRARPWTRAG